MEETLNTLKSLFGGKKKAEDVHFYDIKFSNYSQFNFANGKTACTYCCLECCLYVLSNYIPFDSSNQEVSRWINRITSEGAKANKSKGFTSCDDCFEFEPKYKKSLKMKIIFTGQVKDNGSFHKLLQRIINYSHKTRKSVTCVLTKPPETILLIFDYYHRRWIIYDSHVRKFDEQKFGAAFYYFKTILDIEKHLKVIFAPLFLGHHRREVEINKDYNMYEGTIVVLGKGFKRTMTSSYASSNQQQLLQQPKSSTTTTTTTTTTTNQQPKFGNVSQLPSYNKQLPQEQKPTMDSSMSSSSYYNNNNNKPPSYIGNNFEYSGSNNNNNHPSSSSSSSSSQPQKNEDTTTIGSGMNNTEDIVKSKDNVIFNLQKELVEKSREIEKLKSGSDEKERIIFKQIERLLQLENLMDQKKKDLERLNLKYESNIEYVKFLEKQNQQLKDEKNQF